MLYLGRTVFVDSIVYTNAPVSMYEGGSARYQIIIPDDLYMAYIAGSGDKFTLNALLWYFEKYYNKTPNELAEAFKEDRFGTLLEECFSERPYENPSAYDVDYVKNIETVQDSYSGEQLELANEYYYIPGTLKLEDGTIIDDCERIYIQVENNHIYFYVPEPYVEQMKVEYERNGWGEFIFNGDLIWCYFNFLGLEREGEDFTLTQTDINNILAYRSSRGLVNPTI